MNHSQLLAVILAELKVLADEGQLDAAAIGPEAVLFGDNSLIDSLALVGLIIKIEEFVLDATGREIQVIDEDAIITGSETPFRSADSLAALALAKATAA